MRSINPYLLLIFLNLTISLASAQDISTVLEKGKTYMEQNDFILADRQFSMVLDSDPNNLEALFYRGKLYTFHLEKYEAAIQDLMKCQIKFYRSQETAYYLGKANYSLKKYDQAVRQFNQATMALIKGEISMDEIVFARALAFLGKEDYSNALKDLDIIVKSLPTAWNVWHYHGKANRGLNRLSAAESDQSKALSLTQDQQFQGMILIERGDVRKDLGNTSGACEDFILAESYGNIFAGARTKDCPGSKRYAADQKEEKWRTEGNPLKAGDLCPSIWAAIRSADDYFESIKGPQRKQIVDWQTEYDVKLEFRNAEGLMVKNSEFSESLDIQLSSGSKSWEPVKRAWDDLVVQVDGCLEAHQEIPVERREDYADKENEGKIVWRLTHPKARGLEFSGWYDIIVGAYYGYQRNSYGLSMYVRIESRVK